VITVTHAIRVYTRVEVGLISNILKELLNSVDTSLVRLARLKQVGRSSATVVLVVAGRGCSNRLVRETNVVARKDKSL
jgi:hypothetical protein